MWLLIGYLLGRGRRRRSPEERERRRGHPVLFLLVCALVARAIGSGSSLWALGLLGLALWLVVR